MKKRRKSRTRLSRNQKTALPGWILFLKKYYLAALIVLLLPVIVGASIGGMRTNQSRAQIPGCSCGGVTDFACWIKCATSSISSGTLPGVPGGGTLPGNLPGGLPGLPPGFARFAPCVTPGNLFSCAQGVVGGQIPLDQSCFSDRNKCSDPVSCLTSCIPGGAVNGVPVTPVTQSPTSGGYVVNNTPIPVRSTPIPPTPVAFSNTQCVREGGSCLNNCPIGRYSFDGTKGCLSPVGYCCKPITSGVTTVPRVTSQPNQSLNIPPITTPGSSQPVVSSGGGKCMCTCTGGGSGTALVLSGGDGIIVRDGQEVSGSVEGITVTGSFPVSSQVECDTTSCQNKAPAIISQQAVGQIRTSTHPITGRTVTTRILTVDPSSIHGTCSSASFSSNP